MPAVCGRDAGSVRGHERKGAEKERGGMRHSTKHSRRDAERNQVNSWILREGRKVGTVTVAGRNIRDPFHLINRALGIPVLAAGCKSFECIAVWKAT